MCGLKVVVGTIVAIGEALEGVGGVGVTTTELSAGSTLGASCGGATAWRSRRIVIAKIPAAATSAAPPMAK